MKYTYMKKIKIRETKRWLNKFYSSNFVEHPLIAYDNSDIDKKVAITQNKRKSGIYRWVNKVNNKTYIGSSLDIGRRFTEYYSYNRISDEKRRYPIHIALLKYGYSNFKLEILEFCHKSDLITR